MYIPEKFGSSRQCRVGVKMAVTHEKISPMSPMLNEPKMQMDSWSSLIIHLSGDVTYTTAYHYYKADVLDIFTVDANEVYCIDWGHSQPYERYVVYFDNDIFDQVFTGEEESRKAIMGFLDHKRYPNLLRLTDPFKDALTTLINAVDPLLGSGESDNIISVFSNVTKLFELVHHIVNAEIQPRASGKANDITVKAIQYINQKFKSVSSLTEVSEQLHVSPEHLSRKFKQDMGVPLKAYLIDKKLQHSRHLLRLGSNVTEAALESGFQNVSYFIQLYKNKYGVTPHKSK